MNCAPGGGAPGPPPQGRLDAVRRFARKCRSNERHCEHVAELAGQIFDGVRKKHRLPEPARELLTAGALLHEIGFLVNHSQHHKHAYHLIMHSDLAGYSAREIELIANVVRYHRRALPKKSHANFAGLPPDDRTLVRRLAGILRIAAALDRSHTQVVTSVRVYARSGRVVLGLSAAEEPQVELWDAHRKTRLFERAFGVGLRFRWKPPEHARREMKVVRGSRRPRRAG